MTHDEMVDELIKIRKSKVYDLVLTPATTDVHQDHKTVTEEAIRAFKHTNIWGYELIWNNLNCQANGFVILKNENIESKVNALKEYKSQQGRDYTSENFIMSLSKIRGVQMGHEYAESFEIIRFVI